MFNSHTELYIKFMYDIFSLRCRRLCSSKFCPVIVKESGHSDLLVCQVLDNLFNHPDI